MRLGARTSLVFTNWKERIDPVRGALFVVILVNLTAIHTYLGPLVHLRPALLSLSVAALSILLNPTLVRWSNLNSVWPTKALLLFLVVIMGSVVFGLSPGGSLFFIIRIYWKILVLFMMLMVSVRDVKDLAFILWAFVISIATLVVLSNSGLMAFSTTNTGLARLSVDGIYDANDLGMLLLMGLPLGFLFYFNSGKLGKVLSFLVIAGAPASIALTGSRGAMVGLAFVAPCLFFATSRINIAKRMGAIGVILAALMIAAPAGYWEQMQTILEPEDDYNLSDEYGRVEIAKRGLGYMAQYPIFGVGIDNFARAEGTISPLALSAMAGEMVQWVAPHNTYVQVGAETGIFGLLIWLILLGGGMIGLLKLRRLIPVSWESESPDRRFLRDVCLFLPITFLAFATTSFFLSHAYTAPFYFLLTFLSGTYLLVQREFQADAARAGRGKGAPRQGMHAGSTRPVPMGAGSGSFRRNVPSGFGPRPPSPPS